MPQPIAVLVVATAAVLATARSGRADDAVAELVVFHGPAVPSAEASAARDRVRDRARTTGLAWIDLSPTAPTATTAPAQLRAGIDAYDELRWDDARTALTAAVDEVWRTGGEALSSSELADVFLYRGLVETQLGNATRAWDDLVRASTIAPVRTLDPMRFPPRAVEAFDRARAAVAALPRATLTVRAEGCAISIDGATAETAELPTGEHVVRVVCAGRAAWGTRVALTAAQTITPPADRASIVPADDVFVAEGRARGAHAIVIASVTDAATGSIIVLRAVDADGHIERRASVRLSDADAVAQLDTALDRVLAVAPAAAVAGAPASPWWRSRWVWLAAGAVLSAAVVVPLTVGDDGGDDGTFTIRPEWTW